MQMTKCGTCAGCAAEAQIIATIDEINARFFPRIVLAPLGEHAPLPMFLVDDRSPAPAATKPPAA